MQAIKCVVVGYVDLFPLLDFRYYCWFYVIVSYCFSPIFIACCCCGGLLYTFLLNYDQIIDTLFIEMVL